MKYMAATKHSEKWYYSKEIRAIAHIMNGGADTSHYVLPIERCASSSKSVILACSQLLRQSMAALGTSGACAWQFAKYCITHPLMNQQGYGKKKTDTHRPSSISASCMAQQTLFFLKGSLLVNQSSTTLPHVPSHHTQRQKSHLLQNYCLGCILLRDEGTENKGIKTSKSSSLKTSVPRT